MSGWRRAWGQCVRALRAEVPCRVHDGQRSSRLVGRPGRPQGGAQAGFTIPEMLIGALLAAAAAALIATAIFQFFLATSTGNHRLVVLSDIQNAALWFSRDASEAQSVAGGTGWVYGSICTSDPTVEYRYSYDPATTSLIREHLVSGVPQSTVAMARHIADMGDVVFSVTGNMVSMTITATSGPVSETATVYVAMRVR